MGFRSVVSELGTRLEHEETRVLRGQVMGEVTLLEKCLLTPWAES